MIWWTAETATGQLADLLRLDAPQRPLEIHPGWAADLANMLSTTGLTYPGYPHNQHRGPADRAFDDVAVVPLVTALICAELDANEACTLDRVHERLVIARGAQDITRRPDHITIRARKLIIDAAGELLCSTRLCHPSLTDGGRYEIRSDVARGVDLVVRFRGAGPRAVQIKRGVTPGLSRPGARFAVSMAGDRRDEGEWIGPAWVATCDHARRFVELTDLINGRRGDQELELWS